MCQNFGAGSLQRENEFNKELSALWISLGTMVMSTDHIYDRGVIKFSNKKNDSNRQWTKIRKQVKNHLSRKFNYEAHFYKALQSQNMNESKLTTNMNNRSIDIS